jgi:hypothetical protein
VPLGAAKIRAIIRKFCWEDVRQGRSWQADGESGAAEIEERRRNLH